MNIKSGLTSIVLCSGVLFASLTYAGSAHHSGKHFLLTKHAAMKLALTDEQQNRISEILTEKRSLVKQAKAARADNKGAFKAIVEADNFDEQQAKETIAKMQTVKAQVLLAKLKSKQQIWQLLDAQQREKLSNIQRKKMKRHQQKEM
ncbi:hypothetical protein J8L98_15865 [Pseudoalteromonas sp. MMG013]|uniref:Spy/CpxP family protein refolding chaperone n=1 Tax=unclassified Pseudoalteromonas TaxID=194690 RepID=UPI001B39643C|nr:MULTISPECIES: hypothetical protein [unclassified Pseudoalteromonas]MBQ4843927.1 hypothetical protein [Pseudoalteromonas sp. MMG005]MBQ4851189.1 hypothetical protein [Pseudoalteromonas sp. MMG012]MBQ4863164.1 hypothetical protein [Pseudoalteromonas sp. MMG013]